MIYLSPSRPMLERYLKLGLPSLSFTIHYFLITLFTIFFMIPPHGDAGNMSRNYSPLSDHINLLKPTGHVMHQQFNIQQPYALPTLYLCVLCLSENKQRLVPLTS